MDNITKALILGLAIAVAYSVAAKMDKNAADATAEEVFLFPQFSISASAEKNTDSKEVEYAFKLSEILDSLEKATTQSVRSAEDRGW